MRISLIFLLSVIFAFVGSNAMALDENRVQYVVCTFLELAEIPQNGEVYTSSKTNFYRLGEFFYPEYDASLFGLRDSYILNALLDLFELTGDRGFLDLFRMKSSKILHSMGGKTQKDFLSTFSSQDLLEGNRVPWNKPFIINLERLGLIPGTSYAFRFWILCPENESFSVRIGERFERYRGLSCWKMYFGDFEYQGEREIVVEPEGQAIVRDVSLRAYQRELVYSGILAKTILRGIKLGCVFEEPLMGKVKDLVTQIVTQVKPPDLDSLETLVAYAPFALTCLYWGAWKDDAAILASGLKIAQRLREGLFGSGKLLDQLEEASGLPGMDAIPELVVECLKREVVFSKEDIAILAWFFLDNLCSRISDSPESLKKFLEAFPGWISLSLANEEILLAFEGWLEKNLSEILTMAFQGNISPEFILHLTKFLLVKNFLKGELQ